MQLDWLVEEIRTTQAKQAAKEESYQIKKDCVRPRRKAGGFVSSIFSPNVSLRSNSQNGEAAP
jgi:hypothetical protein